MSEVVNLEELCTGIIDCPHSTPKWQDKGIPVIRNYNLKDGKIDCTNLSFVSEEGYKERVKRAIPEESDIIISREAPMGVVGIVPKGFQCCLGQRLVLLKIDKSKCLPKYLLYTLMSEYVQLQIRRINQTGSIVSNLNISSLRELKIPLHSFEEQKKIANILSAIDAKISLNNQINQELEAMAKTLYDYWFVQFDFPDQNGKPYKSSGGKMVYHPDLKREIPEGWGVARLDQLQIATGKRDANFGTENGKYDFWTTANSPIKADEFSFEGKAILIAGNGNFYVNFTDGKFEAYQRTYVIQSEDEKMLIFMYMACLQSAEKLRKASNGSIIKYITIGDVNNISSPYDHNVVDEFVKIYRPLIDQISKNKKQNQELTQLRDWLLPMLMNGQVKVE
ncbi:MAG: restriction endonuclease subunit S [Streptococcus salivarius]|nr:restriction endonuclease subunit S [Streptococcus salivarius]